MRDWLNAILSLIGGPSLTDLEYGSVNVTDLTVNDYNQAAYTQLSNVLASREAVSEMQERLVAFFLVKGTRVVPASTGKSNIYMGSVLE